MNTLQRPALSLRFLFAAAAVLFFPQARAQNLALPDLERTTLSAPASAHRLVLHREAGSYYILMQDLFTMVDSLFADSYAAWNPVDGRMELSADGHSFQVLAGEPALIIDGARQAVEQSILVRSDRVLVPKTTVDRILALLEVEYVVPAPEPGRAVEAPAIPAGLLDSALTAAARPQSALLPAVRLSATTPTADAGARPTILSAPEGWHEAASLTWGQLADLRHRQPPAIILLICNSRMEPATRQVRDRLRSDPRIRQVMVLTVDEPRRDQPGLVRQANARRPELVIDLNGYVAAERADPTPEPVRVWVVGDVIWPGSRLGERSAAIRPEDAYRAHQFHGWALGSLLHSELTRRLPDRSSSFEFAPSWLLRRLDAPAVALLVPLEPGEQPLEPGPMREQLVWAVSQAVTRYLDGMERVAF